LRKAAECKPDVVILELELPDLDGLGVLRTLQEWSEIPVLVLSERGHDSAKVAALDAGARDYLTKPFSVDELLARLRVLQRAMPNVPEGPLVVAGELVANLSTHEISCRGRRLWLTRKEEALFYVLARYAGKVVTCSHLMRSVWGTYSQDRTPELRVHMTNLRKKLADYRDELRIETKGRLGYSLSLATEDAAFTSPGSPLNRPRESSLGRQPILAGPSFALALGLKPR
jgi:two-component system KDP operon response regulator KdpE